MEQQTISPDLSSREVVQRKIAGALDYLGKNYNIIDKSVREGKATNMDIARSFTGDIKSDKLSENFGLLDFISPLGAYFAAEEGQEAIEKAEPDKFKRSMALLSYMRQPLATTIARPEIGLPATDIALGAIEAIPFGYVLTKPVRGFLKSLKAKVPTTTKNSGMIEQETSLPSSGEASTAIKPVENEEIDQSRRKFIKNTGTLGALGALTTVAPSISKIPFEKIKMSKKVIPKIPISFDKSLKEFAMPLYRNYLDEVIDNNKVLNKDGEEVFEDLPITDENAFDENSITANIYDGLFSNRTFNEGALSEFSDLSLEEKAKLIEKKYGVKDGLHIKPSELSKKLLIDSSVDFGGDYEHEFRMALQNRAIEDGAKPTELVEKIPEYAGIMVYKDAKASDNMADVIEEYYKKLIKDGFTPNDISEMVFESPFPE